MKKLLLVIIGLTFLLTFKIFSDYSIDRKGRNIIEGNNVKIFIEKDYLTKMEMASFVIKIERGISRVKKYLGEDNIKSKKKVQIHLKAGDFVSSGHGGVITLAHVKEKKDPYIHELVHIIAGVGKGGWWLREGFAVYLDVALEDRLFTNWEDDLHELSKFYMESGEYKEILGIGRRYDYVHFGKTTETDYIFSGSLVKFIIENYGKEYFFKLYNEENSKFFLREEGKNILEEWKDEVRR